MVRSFAPSCTHSTGVPFQLAAEPSYRLLLASSIGPLQATRSVRPSPAQESSRGSLGACGFPWKYRTGRGFAGFGSSCGLPRCADPGTSQFVTPSHERPTLPGAGTSGGGEPARPRISTQRPVVCAFAAGESIVTD